MTPVSVMAGVSFPGRYMETVVPSTLTTAMATLSPLSFSALTVTVSLPISSSTQSIRSVRKSMPSSAMLM